MASAPLMSEVQKHEGGSIKHDVAVPVARVPEFIARANQLVELMIRRPARPSAISAMAISTTM